ncbi:MAG TPA: hypothetical protein VNJ08_10675 [Bacteriovoracaceae bacterium]|nr:hypothetical protein [Bacteriovoracaceae bacterium]
MTWHPGGLNVYVVSSASSATKVSSEAFRAPASVPIPDASNLTTKMQQEIKDQGVIISDSVVVKSDSVVLSKEAKKFPYKEFYRETGDLE